MSITTTHNTIDIDQASDGQHQPKCCAVCQESRDYALVRFRDIDNRLSAIQAVIQTALDEGRLDVEVATELAEAGGFGLDRTYRVGVTVEVEGSDSVEVELDEDVVTEAVEAALMDTSQFSGVDLRLEFPTTTTMEVWTTFAFTFTLSVDVEVPVGEDFDECVRESVLESGDLPGSGTYTYEITHMTVDSKRLVV